MTTGRINQIANVIPPTHAEEELETSLSPCGASGGATSKRSAPQSLVLFFSTQITRGRGIPFRGGNRDAIACEGSEHLAAAARGRDVFPLLTHRHSITRRDRGRRRHPSVGVRRRLPTVVPRESLCAVLLAHHPLGRSTK